MVTLAESRDLIRFPVLPSSTDKEFIPYFSKSQDIPLSTLLEHFKRFEGELRKAYAQQPDHDVVKDRKDNLVLIFDGHELYIMSLKDVDRKANYSTAVVTSLKDFQPLLGLSTHANDMEPLIFVIGFGAEQRALLEEKIPPLLQAHLVSVALENLKQGSLENWTLLQPSVLIHRQEVARYLLSGGSNLRHCDKAGRNITQNMVIFKIGAKTDPKKLNQLVSLFDKAAVGGMLLERYTKKPVALKPISYWMADNCRSHRKPEIVTIPSKYSNGKDLAMINRKGYLLLHIAIKQSLGSITSFLLSLNPHDYNQVAHRPACEFINDENGPEESKQMETKNEKGIFWMAMYKSRLFRGPEDLTIDSESSVASFVYSLTAQSLEEIPGLGLIMRAVISLVVAAFASQCLTAELLTPEKVEEGVQTADLEQNLSNLYQIAKDNGGNRAFGLPGYKASSDYIIERMQTKFGDQFDTSLQYFNHTFEQTLNISVTGPDGENVAAVTLLYNNATPLPDGVTAPLIDTPVDDSIGSACNEDQWTGIDATGKIALIKRGTCAIADKLRLAKAHGALGAIVWNQIAGTPGSATLSSENIGLIVPVALVTMDVGEAWKKRLAAGEELVINLLVDSVFEERESWNILAETKEGDPNNVVFLGAHLDSVQAGPGINDDGSGTSGILEIATAFRNYTGYKNKVRFAWWGAEESGLIGSLYYTSHLSESEADKIRFYFNYDMIGSPFPVYAVYKGENPGDGVGAQVLYDYLVAAGKPAYFGSFGNSSDYVGFLQLGIPSSGLFTGAGQPADPCYHLACDTTDNVDSEALTLNAKAAGYVAAKFALSLEGVPPRNKTTVNRRSKDHIQAEFAKWKTASEEAADTHTCAHKSKNTV
ncbi:unnamed protein product [Diplocarpon coronariae]